MSTDTVETLIKILNELAALRREIQSQASSGPGWLTRKGARTYCGLSIPTIDRAMATGSFEVRRVGRTPLINRESLDTWIRGQ